MFVPIVPHTTVINKNIVYTDTVLPLKDIGADIKATSIKNIDEHSLENCLKIIFESNPNVIFNTIQYSKNDKIVYFYTNKDITTKAYEESKFISYKPIKSTKDVLEEVKSVLLSSKIKDADCISLYEVLVLLKKLYREYNAIGKTYKSRFDFIVKRKFNESSSVVYHDFDYEKNILHISFGKYISSDYSDMYFSKKDGDLYVVKSESYCTDEVFSVLCSDLSGMYDELLKYSDYKDYDYIKRDINPINSNFSINISDDGIRLYVKNMDKDLELFAPSYKSDYELRCNSSIIHEVLNNKESELLKNIYVKISDCPIWSQDMLFKIRQNQLEEEQRIEEKTKYKEIKKQKRLELRRKIFPFIKK